MTNFCFEDLHFRPGSGISEQVKDDRKKKEFLVEAGHEVMAGGRDIEFPRAYRTDQFIDRSDIEMRRAGTAAFLINPRHSRSGIAGRRQGFPGNCHRRKLTEGLERQRKSSMNPAANQRFQGCQGQNPQKKLRLLVGQLFDTRPPGNEAQKNTVAGRIERRGEQSDGPFREFDFCMDIKVNDVWANLSQHVAECGRDPESQPLRAVIAPGEEMNVHFLLFAG